MAAEKTNMAADTRTNSTDCFLDRIPEGISRMAVLGVFQINVRIHNAVKSHGRRPGRHHGHQDPHHLPQGQRVIAPSQHNGGQSKGQGKYGMGKFNHPAIDQNLVFKARKLHRIIS